MSWISDAHRDWHTVYGEYNSNCPLDCGAMSPEQREAEDRYEWEAYETEVGHIRCAHCKGKHTSTANVRICAANHA